jgi:DnaK suppressor protein
MATATNGNRRGRLSSRTDHATLQQLLDREQQVLRARMGALRETARGEMQETTDVEERSEELVDFGVGVAALRLTARTVQSIETALQRFDAGTYGVCPDCRGPIEPGRLRAMPFAELCRRCQERYDGFRRNRLEAV